MYSVTRSIYAVSARTVLYAEDDDDDALFMRMALERVGVSHRFARVEDGRRALDYLGGQGDYADRQKYPLPSLLLLDLKLPIKSGFEILEWIGKQPALRNLKVVVVSSSGQQLDIELARKMGAIDYVIKPSVPSRLPEVIRRGWERWFQ